MPDLAFIPDAVMWTDPYSTAFLAFAFLAPVLTEIAA